MSIAVHEDMEDPPIDWKQPFRQRSLMLKSAATQLQIELARFKSVWSQEEKKLSSGPMEKVRLNPTTKPSSISYSPTNNEKPQICEPSSAWGETLKVLESLWQSVIVHIQLKPFKLIFNFIVNLLICMPIIGKRYFQHNKLSKSIHFKNIQKYNFFIW